MKNKLDIIVQHTFPFHFIALGAGLIIVAVLIMLNNPWLAGPLFILGILLTSTHYRLALNMREKKYKEYYWILGFKKGEKLPYEQLEFIYINEVQMASGYGYVTRINISSNYYKGYIKLLNEEPIFIGESKHEKKIMQKAQRLADTLNLEIVRNY